MKFTIAAQPIGTDIISLADMKEFLRVDYTDEDATITALIDSAVQYVQNYTGLHFKLTTFSMNLDWFHYVDIPSQIISVTSVQYYDISNDIQTLDVSKYYADASHEPARVAFLTPPSTFDDRFNSVIINGTLGISPPAPPLVHAMKMLCAHYYENRRAVVVGAMSSKIPLGIENILNPYRIISLK